MNQVVEITESAAYRVKEMMRHNGEEGSYLRVAVNGGGCSGLTYGLGFDKEKTEQDYLLTQHGIQVLVSQEDAAILEGTKVDIEDGVVKLRLLGACGSCPSSTITLKAGIERALLEEVPGVVEVEQVF